MLKSIARLDGPLTGKDERGLRGSGTKLALGEAPPKNIRMVVHSGCR